jgi:Asp-tRNA(Asn)/Glu-tRNA(Gln) amidotransferase A subunit family amidase
MLATTQTRPTDLCALEAGELARLIAAGEISSVEAVEAHIQRIEQVNGKLNAVVVKRYDAARAEARETDRRRAAGEKLGPLAGVPITVKECFDLAATPATFGLPARANAIASVDDPYVARLRAAGAVILGKTNVPQLLLATESDNPVYGRTNNPWDLERSCGGSSGGEGAIIAARGAPLGLGNDIGGSVRIPAAFCGIASIRPTAGRTPDFGRHSVPVGQRAIVSQVGPMARSVADLALGLEIINGGRDPQVEPPMPLGDYRMVDLAKLRVAVFTDDGNFTPSPAAQRAVREAADVLRAAGAQVTPWQPPAVAQAIALFFGILTADGGAGMKRRLRGQKQDPGIAQLKLLAGAPRWLLLTMASLLRLAGQQRLAAGLPLFGHSDTDHYWQAVEALMDYGTQFRASLDAAPDGPFDLILCPAYAVPALRHGASLYLTLPGVYTLLANLTGYPAGVVPLTRVRADEESARPQSRDIVEKTAIETERGSAGLPIGVQVMARPWREHVALAAMSAIEAAARRRPDFPAVPPL